jgi:prophage regulatory protein
MYLEVHMTSRILRLPNVKSHTGLSRSSIYLRVSQGTFPKPISLGGRAVGWLEADVIGWVTLRVALSRPQ